MKPKDLVLPDERDLAVYYAHLLKQGKIKKPKPLENVVKLYCVTLGDLYLNFEHVNLV